VALPVGMVVGRSAGNDSDGIALRVRESPCDRDGTGINADLRYSWTAIRSAN